MWTSNKMIALYILLGLAAVAVGAWFLLRKTLRTRLNMKKSLVADPDINDWLIAFGWTPKILYVPTILVSLVAALLMYLQETQWGPLQGIPIRLVGSIWFTIFLLNLIIEEYDVGIKSLVVGIAGIGFVFLWLHLLGWAGGFLHAFRYLGFSISGTGYLLLAIVGSLVILFSWLRGLFYYVAITPNYMNIQEGPTETGEQIGREDYNTRIDTGDFLERLCGFGRIVITFKEKSRVPLILLVWGIQKKAQALESVRAKFALDLPQNQPAAPNPKPEPEKPQPNS